MIKKVLSLGLLLIMALSVAACGGTTDWQSRLDELNEKIERQTERAAELESEVAKQAEKIAKSEEENKFLEDMIDELEDEMEGLVGPGIQAISTFVDDPCPNVYAAYKTIKTTFKIDLQSFGRNRYFVYNMV